LKAVVELLQDKLANPRAVDRLRADLFRKLEAQAGAAQEARDRLRGRVEDLGKKIAKGNENLLLLPADLVPGAVAQLRAWQAEREQAERDLAALEAGGPADLSAGQVSEALGLLGQLVELIEGAPPDKIRTALRQLVAQAKLYFKHAEEGKRGTRLSHL
jgi:hypothetical protein